MWMNCAFDDTSMKFGTWLEHTIKKNFSYRAITDLSYGHNGGHFSKWPPPVIILPVSQVLDHLGSWFLWLILHFQGSWMTWYNSKHSSNSPATYIWYPMAIMVAIGKKWRPPVIIWPVAQVLHHLGSWFWWLIIHFQGWGMQWYYLQHASNYLTTYI